ncbi:MAG: hypothetical protein ABSA58_15475 [Acetobacteraceae bacterium]
MSESAHALYELLCQGSMNRVGGSDNLMTNQPWTKDFGADLP